MQGRYRATSESTNHDVYLLMSFRDSEASLQFEEESIFVQKLETEAAERRYQLKRKQMLYFPRGGQNLLSEHSYQEPSVYRATQPLSGRHDNDRLDYAAQIGPRTPQIDWRRRKDSAQKDYASEREAGSSMPVLKDRADEDAIRESSEKQPRRKNTQRHDSQVRRLLSIPHIDSDDSVVEGKKIQDIGPIAHREHKNSSATSQLDQAPKSSHVPVDMKNTTVFTSAKDETIATSRSSSQRISTAVSESTPATSAMASSIIQERDSAMSQSPHSTRTTKTQAMSSHTAIELSHGEQSIDVIDQAQSVNVFLLSQLPYVAFKSQPQATSSISTKPTKK